MFPLSITCSLSKTDDDSVISSRLFTVGVNIFICIGIGVCKVVLLIQGIRRVWIKPEIGAHYKGKIKKLGLLKDLKEMNDF